MADPAVIIEVSSSAVPGFDPWTFGSRAQALTHVATATARLEPPKLRVILNSLCFLAVSYSVFSKCGQLHSGHTLPLIVAL